jgi:DNA-binding NtrC family response regulator
MSEKDLPVLIADDQRDVLEALRLLLKSEEHTCRAFGDPVSALAAVRNTQFSVALIDLNYTRDTTSGAEGLELLKALKRADPDLPVVAMTAWGSIHLAVEAMRLGAGDFIEKPWDNTRLISVLRNQIALGAAVRREQRLRA